MIKVIIERRLKKRGNIAQLFRQLRAAAMAYRGYISGETLANTEDNTSITVVSTWRSLEDWKTWEASEQRAAIDRQIESLLVERPVARTYSVMSAEELEYLEDPAGWFREKEHPSFDG